MQWWEINRFLSGLHRRYHANYKSVRMLQWTLACMFHNEKSPPPKRPEDMYKFAWEEQEEQQPQMTDEDVAELQDLIRGFSWN